MIFTGLKRKIQFFLGPFDNWLNRMSVIYNKKTILLNLFNQQKKNILIKRYIYKMAGFHSEQQKTNVFSTFEAYKSISNEV
jgi:hypothetical protein